MTPQIVKEWIAALGGTRFHLTVGAGLVNAILCWHGKLTSADFVLVTASTVSVYIAAAAYSHKVDTNAKPS